LGAGLWLLSSGLAAAEEGVEDCSVTPPEEGALVAVGYGRGFSDMALARAREQAKQRLMGRICQSYGELRCALMASHIQDWKAGKVKGFGNKVCAVAAIQGKHLQSLERATKLYAANLGKLANSSAEGAGQRSIYLETPVWSETGCPAAAAGALIKGEVRNALAGLGTPVSLAPEDAPKLRLELAGVKHRARSSSGRQQPSEPYWAELQVAGTLVPAGGSSGAALPGFRVDLDVLGLEGGEINQCAEVTEREVGVGSVPVVGTVMVNGQAVEETHQINGCTSIDAAALVVAQQDEVQGAAAGKAHVLTQSFLSQSQQLCQQYERFVISQADYVRKTDELSEQYRSDLMRLLSGGGKAQKQQSAAGPLKMEVQAQFFDGRPLVSGTQVTHLDEFVLYATVDQAAHVYLVYENSAGEEVVFPDTADGFSLRPGERFQLPQPGFKFRVDDNAGRAEIVHVLASRSPLPVRHVSTADLVAVAQRGRSHSQESVAVHTDGCGEPTQALALSKRTRGLDMVAFDSDASGQQSGSEDACYQSWHGDTDKQVEGYESIVYTLTLDHI